MNDNRSDNILRLDRLIKRSKANLANHNCGIQDHNKYMINDIIYDEQKRLVSVFKDFLLWDESSDFLRR